MTKAINARGGEGALNLPHREMPKARQHRPADQSGDHSNTKGSVLHSDRGGAGRGGQADVLTPINCGQALLRFAIGWTVLIDPHDLSQPTPKEPPHGCRSPWPQDQRVSFRQVGVAAMSLDRVFPIASCTKGQPGSGQPAREPQRERGDIWLEAC